MTRPRSWLPTSLLLLALLAAWPSLTAHAQFEARKAAVYLGQPARLWAEWGGTPLREARLRLPAGWELTEAHALHEGARIGAEAERDESAYRLRFARPLASGTQLLLRVSVPDAFGGGREGAATWALAPVRDGVPGAPDHFEVLAEPAPVALDNHVWVRRADDALLRLRRDAHPELALDAPFTLELWMKTLALEQVVLSTWDGVDASPYPIELEIDAAGRLHAYRGDGVEHASMHTRAPLADGRWHHVAVIHAPDAGWAHLLVDGARVDSLRLPDVAAPRRHALTLGGRDHAPRGLAARGFAGAIDEVRLWDSARTPAALRALQRLTLETGPGRLCLRFEDALPPRLLRTPPVRVRRVASELSFRDPVRHVQARLDDALVRLSWEADVRDTDAFIVERSTDGKRYAPIASLTPASGLPVEAGSRAFEMSDPTPAAAVVFYRIRRRHAAGDALSPVVKLGLGAEQPQTATLEGNFPNPFATTTTVRYTLHEAASVRVEVWDLSGQRRAVLLTEAQEPRTYEVPFDARDLPSGTYFIRLQVGDRVLTHQMIVAR